VTRSFPDFVPGGLLSDKPVRLLAGVVGGDLDAANGVDHGDARTFTLWGEIAYQLRGVEGYGLVRHSDEQRVAPGTQVWEKLIGAEPALVMIDEIAQHLRSAKAVKSSGGGTNLAEQTVAFLMSLIKFAAESPRSEYFNRMIGQGVDLPSRATRPEFRAEVGQDYAFHPELLTTLNRKTSTIPNFQKTRGVLRLLAQVLRGLWRDRPADCYLIAPHHLDLGDPTRFGRPGSGRVVRCSGRCTSGSPSCSCIALSSTSRGRSSTASRPWPGKSTPDFRPRTDC
jgi:predicted AAA+ superfamily ATPase